MSAKNSCSVAKLCQQVQNCTLCSSLLPHKPRPIFLFNPTARINLISQAPGRLAHESGIAWNDASGNRLRDWLGLTTHEFYNLGLVNVLPMGFCFPGYKNGADAPPIKICAPTWHPEFLAKSAAVFHIYIGRYAQQYYWPNYPTLTSAVADWQTLLKESALVLPHPSGRNNRWLAKHPWFEHSLLPQVRETISQILGR
ncbi:uracil-DNA glycosylase family protein [Alteromonas flava]|uniref:uracil-DNA glycosylase family protein n=1 Tax=Alteromonas flava TaxID=2048003 RepID=UPI000C28CF08|nr:uracil-DNA glycosylase family protein [Alteromonas flava]